MNRIITILSKLADDAGQKIRWLTPSRVAYKGGGLFVATLLLITGFQSVFATVTIEIVNDSGLPDSNVFVKVPGYMIDSNVPMTPTNLNLFVDLSNSAPANPTSVALSTLPSEGSIISTISGDTDLIYTCQVDYVKSGTMYFTYNEPFTFTNRLTPSPPPDTAGNACRYDYAEFTIDDTNAANNAIDVTYVDKFGIPLQLEWFQGTNSSPVAGSYVYASTKTLVNAFQTAGLGQAVFALSSTNISAGWQYSGPDSYTNFARILAPQKVSGTGYSVSPYPDVSNYLNSLAGPSHAFWLNGSAPQGGYYYVGYQASISPDPGGWLVTLAPTTNVPNFDTNLISVGQIPYTNTITFEIEDTNASQYVYGAPVGPGYYSVNDVLVTNTANATYNVETWMIGDVLSSLNFGFWGGVYGSNSADWYSPMQWTAFPFGSARAVNDGYYNPYAALIYDYADPYSFAFSERITPDVLMSPTNGDTIRITILPDDRLDSPVVSVPTNLITSSSITLNWNAISGAAGYQVNVLRPSGIPSAMTSATSFTLTNLAPGTPYVMSVQATNSVAGNPIFTPARPVYATTTGTYSSITNGTASNAIPIQVTFNASDPYFQLGTVFINGIEITRTNNVSPWENALGQNAGWPAFVGTNQVVVTVKDNNNRIIFNDWLRFILAQPFTFTNLGTNKTGGVSFISTNSAISGLSLGGQKLSQPAPTVSAWPNGIVGAIPGFGPSIVEVTNYIGSATNFMFSLPGSATIIGLDYVPAETRKFAPLTSFGPQPPVWTGFTTLANGVFQLQYLNNGSNSFDVYASSNLVNWSNIGAGSIVSPGVYQFSDSNAMQYKYRFYQLRSQ